MNALGDIYIHFTKSKNVKKSTWSLLLQAMQDFFYSCLSGKLDDLAGCIYNDDNTKSINCLCGMR